MRRGIGIGLGVLGLLGCVTRGATSLAGHERQARTGLDAGDALALLVAAPDAEAASRLARCLGEGLGERALHAAGDVLGAPPAAADTAALGTWLERAEVQERRGASRIRYLLALDAQTEDSGFPVGGAGGQGWMIGRAAQRITRIGVEVLDARTGATAGRVSAKAYGESGWGILFLLFVLPIPTVQDAQTETEACRAVAAELTRFLEDPLPHDD